LATDEWIPSLAAISKTLQQIPIDIPPIDWLPVDITGQAICELALQAHKDKEIYNPTQKPSRNLLDEQENGDAQSPPLKVFNVVNPHLTDWSVFVDVLRARIGATVQLVTLEEWVHTLSITDPREMSRAEAAASTKILPFFQHLAETAATGASPSMAGVKAIDKVLIDLWCQQWGL
jgi:hypothetical protein